MPSDYLSTIGLISFIDSGMPMIVILFIISALPMIIIMSFKPFSGQSRLCLIDRLMSKKLFHLCFCS